MLLDEQIIGQFIRAIAGTRLRRRSIRAKPDFNKRHGYAGLLGFRNQ